MHSVIVSTKLLATLSSFIDYIVFVFLECLHSLILKYGIVNSILHFAKSSDIAVQFWASALLLNLSMISDEVKETIIRSGGINILLEMAVSGDEVELPDIATNATKTLVILGFLGMTMFLSFCVWYYPAAK